LIVGVYERKERERELRRKEIIDAAEKVFFLKGWKNATMDEVAEAAELSKGTLYLYYRNKDEIFLAINYRGVQILVDLFKKAILDAGNGLEKTFALGRAYYEFAKTYPDYYNALSYFELNELEFLDTDREESLATLCSDCGQQALQILIDALKEGVEDGSIRPGIDPKLVATILWGQTTGVIELLMLKGDHMQTQHGFDMTGIVEKSFDFIRCALENKSGA
jgi:AcrR family transcriptional regulator